MKKQEFAHESVLNTILKDRYFVCEKLGSGVSSKVYLAVDKQTNKQVAIKVIAKSYLNSDKKLFELVKTQIYILKNCNNQNVVKCYDVFQSAHSIFLVIQYCNGKDMQKYVTTKIYLSEDNAIWYLKQILNGFKGLHQIGAMHRDFKLANLLLHDRVCKIADMGFAKQMTENDLTDTILGTQITMAPEVLQRKPYGINADIWSLGVVFYQMLTGKYPYLGNSTSDLLKNIKNRNNDFSTLKISPLAKNFIQGCLTVDPNSRITWVQIYNHPLLNKKTIQLTYGISKTSQIFYENQEFYRLQSFEDGQQSLLILRHSARKQIIIQQIQSNYKKPADCLAILRSSIQVSQPTKLLIKNGINYGAYLNELSYPMKFLNMELAYFVPHIDHLTPFYLIYKKSYNQIRQFYCVMKRRIDIFKMEVVQQQLWKQFLKCSIYADMTNIVKNCCERAEKIFTDLQNLMKKIYKNGPNKQDKLISEVVLDDRIQKQLSEKGVDRKQFLDLLEIYKFKYAKQLMKSLIESQKQNISLIDLSEALLYYMDAAGKDKMKPERFDWNRSAPIKYKEAKPMTLIKFKMYFQGVSINPTK